MRITRTIADEAAKKMSSAQFDSKIKKLELKRMELGEKIAKEYIPLEVRKLAEKYPNFFELSQTIYVSTEGYYGIYILANNQYPNFNCGRSIPISKSDFICIKKMNEERTYLIKEKEQLETRISDTLVAIKTLDKIKKEFPEAVKYIECEEKSLPALKIDDLRNLFK